MAFTLKEVKLEVSCDYCQKKLIFRQPQQAKGWVLFRFGSTPEYNFYAIACQGCASTIKDDTFVYPATRYTLQFDIEVSPHTA